MLHFFQIIVGDDITDDILKSAHKDDSSECIERLLCELQTKQDEDLEWDEIIIKNFIPPGDFKFAYCNSARFCQFQFATNIGSQSKNLEKCASIYAR